MRSPFFFWIHSGASYADWCVEIVCGLSGMRRQDSHTNAALDKLEEEEKIHLDSADNYVLGPAPEESEESGSEDVEVDERVAGCSSGSKHNHFLKNTIITAFCISDLQASARRQEVAEQTC